MPHPLNFDSLDSPDPLDSPDLRNAPPTSVAQGGGGYGRAGRSEGFGLADPASWSAQKLKATEMSPFTVTGPNFVAAAAPPFSQEPAAW